MDSLKQRIVDYVAANQPVKRADLIVVIGISGKIAALRRPEWSQSVQLDPTLDGIHPKL
ncbi:hypothetical protein ACFC2F_22995 [Enterobacter sichuanensis]|uniref:hypothetical protein n=1 Tax=Enterobacter sichuanensis TaxID=2071710 RepID=UPI0036D30B20